MIRVDASATIDRPVEDVAHYLTDIERMTEWTDMTASRRLTEGPTKDGTKAYAEVAMGPVKLGWTYEIQDVDTNGGFAFKTITRNALEPQIRTARPADRAALLELHRHSLRTLGRGFYSDAEIESFLRDQD